MHTAAIEPSIYNNYPTAPSAHYIFCIYYHYVLVVKFWTKHGKMSDGTTGKIVSLTNRNLAPAYVLCHPTLLLSLFQKYRMEIPSRIEEEIQETTTREEWEKLS